MFKTLWDEFREVVWLASMIAGLSERLITIGVFVALALLAGYNFQASQSALIDTVAQAQIRSGR